MFNLLQGTHNCGVCEKGYIGNQTVGCRKQRGLCDDGVTVCDVNAMCVDRGLSGYHCQVGQGH